MLRSVVLLIFLVIVLHSCKKKENADEFPPAFRVISMIPALITDTVCGFSSDVVIPLQVNQALKITLEFTDDKALSQAKFDIHNNFNCHGHKNQKSGVIWNVIDIVQLQGTKQQITVTLQPPENVVTGNYHLGIMAVDLEGRIAEPVFLDLKLLNPDDMEPPWIVLDSPYQNQSISLQNEFTIRGTIYDNMALGNGSLELYILSPSNIEFTIARIDFPSNTTEAFEFTYNYTAAPFFQPGNYVLKCIAKDASNNETTLNRNLLFN